MGGWARSICGGADRSREACQDGETKLLIVLGVSGGEAVLLCSPAFILCRTGAWRQVGRGQPLNAPLAKSRASRLPDDARKSGLLSKAITLPPMLSLLPDVTV